MMDKLKALLDSARSNTYKYDNPDYDILETFPRPVCAGSMSINITAPEFTSLCPKTGQPDFATIVVDYRPDSYCVESKSFKLYLMAFRNHGAFHEECVAKILNDLVRVLDPLELTVKGEFTARGGIPFHPTVMYKKIPPFLGMPEPPLNPPSPAQQ